MPRIQGVNANDIPVGSVAPYAGGVIPEGWLLCDGRAFAQSALPKLFAVIGTKHGNGTAAAVGAPVPMGGFNIPDYRGRFLRGVAGDSTIDPDRIARTAMLAGGATGNDIGTVQGAAFASHRHLVVTPPIGNNEPLGPNTSIVGSANLAVSGGRLENANFEYTLQGESDEPTQGRTNIQGGSTETRPVNAYVNYIIKFR